MIQRWKYQACLCTTLESQARPVTVQHMSSCKSSLHVSNEVNKAGFVCICTWQAVSTSVLHKLRFQRWSVTTYELCSCVTGIRGNVEVKQRSQGALNPSSFICYAPRLPHLLIKHIPAGLWSPLPYGSGEGTSLSKVRLLKEAPARSHVVLI